MNWFRRFLTVLFIVVSLNVKQTQEKGVGALSLGVGLVSLGLDIFNTALSIVDWLKKPDSLDLDNLKNEILREISEMLTHLQTEIIIVVQVENKVQDLNRIKSKIESSNEYLNRYLRARGTTDESLQKEQFTNSYTSSSVADATFELSSILTDVVPGLSRPMTEYIVEITNCNMTAIVNFEEFFGNLVKMGVTLEYIYTELQGLNLQFVQNYWNNDALPKIQTAFDKIENECVVKFPTSIAEEVKQDVTLEVLHRNSNERYNWKWNDVYQYEPRDTNAQTWNYYISLNISDPFLFWNGPAPGSNPIRIAVFGDKNTSVKHWDKSVVQTHLEANVDILKENSNWNAKTLATNVGKLINDINFVYTAIICLYGVLDTPPTVIIDEQYSPVAQVFVPISGYVGYYAYVYPEIWNNFTSYTYAEKDVCCGCGKTTLNDKIAMLAFITIVILIIKQ